jgi:hypothetical protein
MSSSARARDYIPALAQGFKVIPNDVDSVASAEVGIPQVFRLTVGNVATSNIDTVLALEGRSFLVTGVKVVKTTAAGGAADTVTVSNTANAITDAIDTNIADKATAEAATIDDAYSSIADGGTLRVAINDGAAGNTACEVYVSGLLV